MPVNANVPPPDLSFDDMKRFLRLGWGDPAGRIADTWLEFNSRFFGGVLKPVPIILVNTSPYGKRVGCCAYSATESETRIELTFPSDGTVLQADRGVLLHEMLHQHLCMQGLKSKHAGKPWCEGIMRLHREITGQEIWAVPQQVGKQRDPRTGARYSVRYQKPSPTTGLPSLTPEEIAMWPHSVKLDFGPL